MGDWGYNPITGKIDRIGGGGGGGGIDTINDVSPGVDGNFQIESSDGSVVINLLADGVDLSVPPGDAPIGQLAYFPNQNGDSYLSGAWLKLNGQILLQATYPTLFSRLGYVNGPFTVFNAVTYTSGNILSQINDGSKFISVGAAGLLYTSTNAITWSAGASTTTAPISSIVFSGSIYAMSATNFVMSSTDLVTWASNMSNNRATSTLKYGNSTFVVSNPDKMITTSTDAISWFTKSPNGSRVAYGNSRIVIGSQQNCILTATDTSVGWKINSANITSNASIAKMQFDGTGFFCVSATSTVGSSTDGYTWTPHATGTTLLFTQMAFGNAVYAFGATTGGASRYSTDLVTYTAGAGSIGSASVAGMTFGAGKFAAINNTTGSIYTSTNAQTWTVVATVAGISSGNFLGFANGLFAIIGATGSYSTSTDAITWAAATGPFGNKAASGFVFGNSIYVLAFNDGTVGTSTNAVTWTVQTTLSTSAANGIAFDGSVFYISADTYLQTSTDAVTWTMVTNLALAPTDGLTQLRFASGLFLLGTNQGKVLTSTDGLTWVTNSTATTSPIAALNLAAGLYLVASGTSLWTSTNLVTYTPAVINTSTTQTFQVLRYLNGLHIAGGNNALIRTSTDGILWGQVTNTLSATATILTFASNPTTIAYGGQNGVAGYSLDSYPYNQATQFQLPIDAQTPITLESTSNFQRSLYIKAL